MKAAGWQYLVYTLAGGVPVTIPPPEGETWTLERIEQWLRQAKHVPGSTIFVDSRKTDDKGPFPGMSAPFLEFRVYRVRADGTLERTDR